MTGSAWESLLNRTRARRGRLCGDEPECVPESAPAHELVIEAIEGLRSDGEASLPPDAGASVVFLCSAVIFASVAETIALRTGSLCDRTLADDALSFALRVAARIAAQPYPWDQEGL
jgi:hypothetical protein